MVDIISVSLFNILCGFECKKVFIQFAVTRIKPERFDKNLNIQAHIFETRMQIN